MPLSDGELSNLLRLRDEVWRTRTLLVLTPPRTDDYKDSCALYFEDSTGRGTFRERLPAQYPPAAA